MKGTKTYLETFNPCRAAQISPPFVVPYFPESSQEYNNIETALQKWVVTISERYPEKEGRALSIRLWFIGNITK
jgi:hypothetical protein